MRPQHILVADDEPRMTRTLWFILSGAGYRVTTVSNGREALDKILGDRRHGEGVDLLITDLFMPHMSGYQLISELAERELSIPTIVITGYGNESTTRKLERLGCRECLFKPFEETQVLDRVAQVLTRSDREMWS